MPAQGCRPRLRQFSATTIAASRGSDCRAAASANCRALGDRRASEIRDTHGPRRCFRSIGHCRPQGPLSPLRQGACFGRPGSAREVRALRAELRIRGLGRRAGGVRHLHSGLPRARRRAAGGVQASVRRCGCTSCCGACSHPLLAFVLLRVLKGVLIALQYKHQAGDGQLRPTEIEREPMLFSKLRQAKLVWPTLATLAALAVLLGLGTWQLERKRWKEGLLAKIADRVAAEPRPVARAAATRAQRRATSNTCTCPRPAASTTTRSAISTLPTPAGLAWHVYTPLEIAPGRIVWVNRGLVPDASKAPSRASGRAGAGRDRSARRRRGCRRARPLFTPQNDAAGNLWYWPDIPALTASAFPTEPAVTALPFTIEADAQPAPPGACPRAASLASPCPTGTWNMPSPGTASP